MQVEEPTVKGSLRHLNNDEKNELRAIFKRAIDTNRRLRIARRMEERTTSETEQDTTDEIRMFVGTAGHKHMLKEHKAKALANLRSFSSNIESYYDYFADLQIIQQDLQLFMNRIDEKYELYCHPQEDTWVSSTSFRDETNQQSADYMEELVRGFLKQNFQQWLSGQEQTEVNIAHHSHLLMKKYDETIRAVDVSKNEYAQKNDELSTTILDSTTFFADAITEIENFAVELNTSIIKPLRYQQLIESIARNATWRNRVEKTPELQQKLSDFRQ